SNGPEPKAQRTKPPFGNGYAAVTPVFPALASDPHTAAQMHFCSVLGVSRAGPDPTGRAEPALRGFPAGASAASLVTAGAIGVVSAVCFLTPAWMRQRRAKLERLIVAAEDPIIAGNTKFVTVRGKRYRVVYVPHGLSNQVPLILFVHGIGSQVLPDGAALPEESGPFLFKICTRGAYTTKSLVDDLAAILNLFPSQSVIVVAHSYGCALATFLCAQCRPRIQALVFIAPTGRVDRALSARLRRLATAPGCLLELGRWMDRRGGAYSASVNRSLGKAAGRDLRERMLLWNSASQTCAVADIFAGMTIPGPADLAKVDCPLLLIAGEEDVIAPPGKNLTIIREALSPPNGKPISDPLIMPG
ncbi:MAG: Alpha/Beta hydrolase protein, partial [Olpidium bornovanus]